MGLVFFGVLWFCIAVLAILFISRRWKDPLNILRIGIALIIFSFLAGLIVLAVSLMI